MGKCIRTIMLKLYKPGKGKKQVLDEAMLNYTEAFQYLLDKAKEDMDVITHECKTIKERYRSAYIKKWINEKYDKDLNIFSIEPFKDSIKIDFAATFCRYLNLKLRGDDSSCPSVHISDLILEKQYKQITLQYINGEKTYLDTENSINNLISKSEKFRPIFFCRYSSKRNYSLLFDADNNKYYAKIYLMNVKSDKRAEHKNSANNSLIYINKNKEIFNEKISKRCYLIFPLCFGKWQESYLKEALQNPEILKTARLIKKEDEYYLAVNIVKEAASLPKPVNFMGVSRGITNLINYCVVDGEGNKIICDSQDLDYENITDNKLYEISNFLAEIAYKHKCQVIMEKLIDKGDGLIWEDKDGRNNVSKLSSPKYNQLLNIINYKISGMGLPEVVRVSPVDIFYTCPSCGNHSKANRFSEELIICTSCGTTMNIENAGSFNLARKLLRYSKDKIKIKVEETPHGVRFINKEIGLEYYPTNPYDCKYEFMEKIDEIIKKFYDNIDTESKFANFRKKLSLIKKLENDKNAFEVIE